MDRTAVKVQKSKGHARVIDSRKKTWDQVNKEAYDLEEARKLSKKARAKAEEDAAVEAFWEDVDGDAEMDGAEEVAAGAAAVPVQPAGEEEEIL
jgi:hypothetical protein